MPGSTVSAPVVGHRLKELAVIVSQAMSSSFRARRSRSLLAKAANQWRMQLPQRDRVLHPEASSRLAVLRVAALRLARCGPRREDVAHGRGTPRRERGATPL